MPLQTYDSRSPYSTPLETRYEFGCDRRCTLAGATHKALDIKARALAQLKQPRPRPAPASYIDFIAASASAAGDRAQWKTKKVQSVVDWVLGTRQVHTYKDGTVAISRNRFFTTPFPAETTEFGPRPTIRDRGLVGEIIICFPPALEVLSLLGAVPNALVRASACTWGALRGIAGRPSQPLTRSDLFQLFRAAELHYYRDDPTIRADMQKPDASNPWRLLIARDYPRVNVSRAPIGPDNGKDMYDLAADLSWFVRGRHSPSYISQRQAAIVKAAARWDATVDFSTATINTRKQEEFCD